MIVAETSSRRASLGTASIAAWAAGALALAAGVWLYSLTRGTTFFQDEWVWVLYRRGNDAAAFLRPHNQHLSLVPMVIYRLLLATAGLRHYGPYRAVVVLGHLGVVAMTYIYARSRVGAFGAVAASALILFFGAAWGNFLWPFQIAWLVSLVCGIGAWLMLDRDQPVGDICACALLAIALASCGLGLPIMLGIGAELAWRREWRRLWIVALPAIPYAAWWLSYQETGMTSRIGTLPGFVLDEVASALAAVVGLAGDTSGAASGTLLSWGRPIAAVAVVLVVARIVHLRRVPPRVFGLVAAIAAFWILTAISRAWIGRPEAWASRYLYVGGLFAVLIAVELLRGLSVPRPLCAVIAAATIAAVIAGASATASGARYLRAQGQVTRAELGAMDITRSIVPPGYDSLVPNFPFPVVLAGPYFSVERAEGTPAATPAQIATSSQAARRAADTELVQIHRVALTPLRACAGRTSAPERFILPARGVILTPLIPGRSVEVSVRRFGDHAIPVGRLSPGAIAALRIGPDGAVQPWRVELAGAATVCGTG